MTQHPYQPFTSIINNCKESFKHQQQRQHQQQPKLVVSRMFIEKKMRNDHLTEST